MRISSQITRYVLLGCCFLPLIIYKFDQKENNISLRWKILDLHTPESSLPLLPVTCPFGNVNSTLEGEAEKLGHDPHGGWFYTEDVIAREHWAFDNGFARGIVKYVTTHTKGKGKNRLQNYKVDHVYIGSIFSWDPAL